jgi:hypothetical protein
LKYSSGQQFLAFPFWEMLVFRPEEEGYFMPTDVIVQELNVEIDRLTRARDLLVGRNGTRVGFRVVRRRRPMSAATKAKIGAAMARTWAARRAKKK